MGVRGQYQHLCSPQATDEDVLDYLAERAAYITEAGGTATALDVYWQPGDLDRYRAAAAVWAKDAPPHFALPELPVLLDGVAGPAGMPTSTFIADLTHCWNRYAAWMASEGRDPAHANETLEERRARKARESMARTRERRAGGTDPERQGKLDAAKTAHDAYLAACRTRATAKEELDAKVREAWAAYELARDNARA